MSWFEALVLGIVQGLTEYLPVSSSGHLAIGSALFGIQGEENLAFTIVVHVATVFSTLVILWKEIEWIFRGLFKFKMNAETRYVINILISMIPIGIVGVFFKDTVEDIFGSGLLIVGCMLLLTAALLAFSYYAKPRQKESISMKDAFIIGLAQACAVMPGLSRSGTTIATGLLLGNNKAKLAQFSFLMVIPPILGEALLDVMKAVKGVDVDCEISLNSYTTVADVNKCKMYMRNFGEFFENQLQYARTIILSRTDTPKATEEKVAKAVALIREVNKDAVIITTPIEKLDGAQILEAMEQGREEDEDFCPVCGGHHDHDHEHEHHHHDHDDECGCDHDHEHEHHHHDHDGECGCDHDHEHEHHHHDHDDECGCGHDHDHEHHHHDGECGCGHEHHHHHADEVFTSWGRETAKKYTKEEIEAALKKLSEAEDLGVILRAKGMVDGKDGQWIYFDMVPEEYEVRTGTPQITGKICVIGSKMAEDKIAEIFGVNK